MIPASLVAVTMIKMRALVDFIKAIGQYITTNVLHSNEYLEIQKNECQKERK